MKEHGILFSGPMVRALLRPVDPKWQTRRAVKPPATFKWIEDTAPGIAPYLRVDTRTGSGSATPEIIHDVCPHPPGTRLWVRETTALLRGMGTGNRIVYRADGEPVLDKHHGTPVPMKWTPSLLMPRSRARIFLDVTGVRVERAQAISDADVAAEGMDAEAVLALWEGATKKHRTELRESYFESDGGDYSRDAGGGRMVLDVRSAPPRDLWRIGWTLINGRASWDANPWVWVYEVRRVP